MGDLAMGHAAMADLAMGDRIVLRHVLTAFEIHRHIEHHRSRLLEDQRQAHQIALMDRMAKPHHHHVIAATGQQMPPMGGDREAALDLAHLHLAIGADLMGVQLDRAARSELAETSRSSRSVVLRISMKAAADFAIGLELRT